MKINLILITATLALGLSGVGCNKSGKLDTASKFAPPSGPVELKIKWPAGESIVMNRETKSDTEIFMPNSPGSIKQNMTMGQKYGLTVLKETPGGGHEVEMEILSTRMELAMRGKTMMNYDSDKGAASGQANPVANIFGKSIGAKIQYFLDVSNDVERIDGVEGLESRLSSGGPADPGVQIFKSIMFSKDYFLQIMSANRFLPPKPVQPGDTWPATLTFGMGLLGTMVMNFDSTFQSWELHGKRNCARIEFQGTVKSTPGTNAVPAALSMTITDGNFSGVSWFDPELGTTIEVTMNQDLKMNMAVPMGGRGNTAGRTQIMTNVMSQVITMKLDSVK